MATRRRGRGGRPSQGLGEAALVVRAQAELMDATRAAAERAGIAHAEWWRRAAQAALEREAAP